MLNRKTLSGIAVLVILLTPEWTIAQKSGSRSYSSGSSSKPAASPSRPSSSSVSRGTPSVSTPNRSYSSGSSSTPSATPGKSYSTGTNTTRPAQPKFDTLAREDKFKSDNRINYNRGTTSQSSYTTPSGQVNNININSRTVQTTRNNITEERWVNRSTRINTTFNNYTVMPMPTVVYHDNYNMFFWLWLLDRSADDRAAWAYHHQADLDAKRMEELRRKDAELDARMKRLEGQPKNANYSPKGIDEDLMYTDQYVDAVYNPAPKHYESSGDWSWFFKILLYVALLTIIGFAIYAFFFWRCF